MFQRGLKPPTRIANELTTDRARDRAGPLLITQGILDLPRSHPLGAGQRLWKPREQLRIGLQQGC